MPRQREYGYAPPPKGQLGPLFGNRRGDPGQIAWNHAVILLQQRRARRRPHRVDVYMNPPRLS